MGANTNTTASTELAKLDEQRIRAAGHVEEPEGEQAPAARAVREAAAALAEARQAVADPALVARLEGARARIRDVHEERQRFVAAHLRELIADPEADAQAAMADMLTPCEQLVQAFDQREQAAGRISALATKAARPSPGDVGPPSRADVATREVTRLLDLSEPAPTLRHYPSQPEHRHVPPGGRCQRDRRPETLHSRPAALVTDGARAKEEHRRRVATILTARPASEALRGWIRIDDRQTAWGAWRERVP